MCECRDDVGIRACNVLTTELQLDTKANGMQRSEAHLRQPTLARA